MEGGLRQMQRGVAGAEGRSGVMLTGHQTLEVRREEAAGSQHPRR